MKKKRCNRLHQVRPCYVCGRKGRHYLDTNNPCLCLACSRMPMDWRAELYGERKRKIDFEKYSRKFEKVKLTNKQIEFSLEPVSLPFYVDGGYPMAYYVNGDFVCGKCIHATLQNCYISERDEILRDVYWEDEPQICTECGTEVKSAYGEVKTKNEN
jgi:hypothetical protein